MLFSPASAVNYWPKHIGPWLAATVTLSMAEEGAYGRLCDWCYKQEQPLPLDTDEVFKIARANSKPDRDTTMTVLQRYFVQTDVGWRHERIERELTNIRNRGARAAVDRDGNRARQARFRARRAALFEQAYDLGLKPPDGMQTTNEVLIALIVQAGEKPRRPQSHALSNALPNSVSTAVAVTALDSENSLLHVREEIASRVTPSRYVTPAGEVCKRIRALGMASVNPSDPRLLELLQLGVDVEAIVMAASEAVARSKGFAWALVRAKGQHDDAQRARDEVLKWAPGLASPLRGNGP